MKEKVKRRNFHLTQVELGELKSKIKFVVEQEDLLLGLEANSISDFETKINALTKFTNPMASANAFGKEAEYKRLLELETLIDGKLSSKDLTKTKELKPPIIEKIIDKHTEFYTETELATKQTLQDLMLTYNSLSLEDRKHIGYNRANELAFNIYSELRF